MLRFGATRTEMHRSEMDRTLQTAKSVFPLFLNNKGFFLLLVASSISQDESRGVTVLMLLFESWRGEAVTLEIFFIFMVEESCSHELFRQV